MMMLRSLFPCLLFPLMATATFLLFVPVTSAQLQGQETAAQARQAASQSVSSEKNETNNKNDNSSSSSSSDTNIVSYVLEPFDRLQEDDGRWFVSASSIRSSPSHNDTNGNSSTEDDGTSRTTPRVPSTTSGRLQLSTTDASNEMSARPLFGEGCLRADFSCFFHNGTSRNGTYSGSNTTSEEEVLTFGWKEMDGRRHMCRGATSLSLWYKLLLFDTSTNNVTQTSGDSGDFGAEGPRTRTTLRLSILHSVGNEPALRSVPVFEKEVLLTKEDVEGATASQRDWQRVHVDLLSGAAASIELSGVRGWSMDITVVPPSGGGGSEVESVNVSGALLLDQLAFHGGGDLFGAAFHLPPPSNNYTYTLQDSIQDKIWLEYYYRSNISRQETTASLHNGTMDLNYTVQQVESWGGLDAMAVVAPGQAYYNLSQANYVVLDYQVMRKASIPERAIFRFLILDNSDCIEGCDVSDNNHERYYSFHEILDTEGKGQISIPLVGSTEGGEAPFWLPGWSGISGNGQLDVSMLKGFTLELVLDSELEIGTTVNGHVLFSDLAAAVDPFHGKYDAMDEDEYCMVEPDLYLLATAPQFRKMHFLGSICCQLCQEDSQCSYALSTGRDCYIASWVDPDFVVLTNTTWEQRSTTSFWIDDDVKRGDFCEKCDCRQESGTIDCSQRDLTIVPKTFNESWVPKVLDLTGNPKLFLLGANALASVASSLEEIQLPSSMKHISRQALSEAHGNIVVKFEKDESSVAGNYVGPNNVITESSEFFHDVCCGRSTPSSAVEREQGLTYCEMQVNTPGADSVYEPFIQYINAAATLVLTPSSDFMSEAADSVEKCAEFCSIDNECMYFGYDARYKNAEHMCNLYENNGTKAEYVCCDDDHYADDNRTDPGWISGRPPRTRHKEDNAAVVTEPRNLFADPTSGHETHYVLSLGARPLRGAVWVTPKLASVVSGFEVTLFPPRAVLYDEDTIVNVTVKVNVIDPTAGSGTIVIVNEVTACDKAFHLSDDGNLVYVDVSVPVSDSNARLLGAVFGSIFAVLFLGVIAFMFNLWQRQKDDYLWKVKPEELLFANPPVVIGHGSFGLVLLAEYRGTAVAVKRVMRPKSSSRAGRPTVDTPSSTALAAADSSEGATNISSSMGSLPHSALMTTSRLRASAGIDSYQLSLFLGPSFADKEETYEAQWRKRKDDFIKEMRILSLLRHPCITTVMGAVIGKNDIEPMLVMEFMSHGSLYDMLHNETLKLEVDTLLPMLQDVSQGIRFLHSSDPRVIHGDLKAQNILIDNKFRAKVSDFGLSKAQKHDGGITGTPTHMAPELLRGVSSNTPASDMYAFGMILYEAFSRQDPYEGENIVDVLFLVVDKTVNMRPPVPPSCPSAVGSIMEECFTADPQKRPTASEVDTRLKRVVADASDVESNLAAHTHCETTGAFSRDAPPTLMAESSPGGPSVLPKQHDMVTILFANIVGFAGIAAKLTQPKVADLLDRLYKRFDQLLDVHDVYKIETIGNAYMTTTNLVKDQGNDHTKRMAQFAMSIVRAAAETLIDPDDTSSGAVGIRVGIHSGPVIANVSEAGYGDGRSSSDPHYCLVGDTVICASRMEDHSQENRIHCSDGFAKLLQKQQSLNGGIPLMSRGLVPIKGKGEMHTYWINELENAPDDTPEAADKKTLFEKEAAPAVSVSFGHDDATTKIKKEKNGPHY